MVREICEKMSKLMNRRLLIGGKKSSSNIIGRGTMNDDKDVLEAKTSEAPPHKMCGLPTSQHLAAYNLWRELVRTSISADKLASMSESEKLLAH